MPGAQNPHWKALCLRNDRCNGVRLASLNPSTVVIWRPSASMARMRQLRTDLPSSRTVQAPQSPRSQPIFGLLTPIFSRRTSSRMSLGSTSTVRCSRLSLRVINFFMLVYGLNQACPVSGPSAGESCDRSAQGAFEHHADHEGPILFGSPNVGDGRNLLRHKPHGGLDQAVRQGLAVQQGFDFVPADGTGSNRAKRDAVVVPGQREDGHAGLGEVFSFVPPEFDEAGGVLLS